LTTTEHAFLLLSEVLDSAHEEPAITAFERLLRERGLPRAIRSDDGVPFASPNAPFNLAKLSTSPPCWRAEPWNQEIDDNLTDIERARNVGVTSKPATATVCPAAASPPHQAWLRRDRRGRLRRRVWQGLAQALTRSLAKSR